MKLGTVTASEFVRTLQAPQRTSTLAGALANVGRVAKSLFLLSYVDDEAYRRRILVQLNVTRSATTWPGRSSTANAVSSANVTGRGRRISSAL